MRKKRGGSGGCDGPRGAATDPGLRRVLNDLPYDHHGLARDPRYARLLRTAGIEEQLN